MSDYAIGQRWLSETEVELGLGIVTGLSGRQLSILFPANGETRAYASKNAPLIRYILDVEDIAQHNEGWSFEVTEVTEADGLRVYHGYHDAEPVQIAETLLHYQVQLSSPLTRMLSGQLSRVSHYELRQRSSDALRHWLDHPARGLLGARIDLLPHQLYIAHTVARRSKPRVLLADEVGLGKTIEAGLIMQSLLLNGEVSRILIRVPDTLLHQWMVELRRRFNLEFSIIDESYCEAALAISEEFENSDDSPEENPFEQAQLALCPASLMDNEGAYKLALQAEWDLVVVDEAHQLEQNQRAQVRDLSQEAGLLLLTATPDQGGADSHFEQLHLLDPERFHDLEAFRAEQEHYHAIAEKADELDANSDALNELLDEHGTGRVLMRNTRGNIKGFPQRRYHLSPVQVDSAQVNEADTSDSDIAKKVTWLHNFAKAQNPEKILVIMQTQLQVEEVAAMLRIRYGRHSAQFHEGMTLLERDRAAAFFADNEDGAQLLLSSEIGGEGRNFQFARHLVMLDLPSHPDKLEQRIGRLDRIGQISAFDIHVPVVSDSRDERLAIWYEEGMQAFTQANATGHRLMQILGDDIEKGITGSTEEFTDLVSRTQQAVADIRAQLAAGRDRLLELNSCRPAKANELCAAVERSDQSTELASFMFSFWDQFGVDVEDKDDQRLILKPGQNFAAQGLPGLDEEGSLVTFDRTTALHYDDVQFLTWEHPQTQAALELVMLDNHGSTCVGLLKNKALPAGHWFLEIYVRASLPQAPTVGLERLYPTPMLRLLIDSQGRNLSSKIDAATLNKQIHFINKKTGAQMIKALRKQIQTLVKEQIVGAEKQLLEACETAAQRRLGAFSREAQRLENLRSRNPSIRQDEIDALKAERAAWETAFAAPQINIDSVRLIVNAGSEG